jgi:hypothetical protein
MSEDNKKRKLEEEDHKTTHSRFENLFKVTPMEEIIHHLVEIGRKPEFHKALEEIFPESDFPLLNLSAHCVRCHSPYDPEHNNLFKCYVPHDGDVEVTKPVESKYVTYTYTCCGQSFQVGPNDVLELVDPTAGICQKSNHTTNIDYVENYVSCSICGVEPEEEGEFDDNIDE